MSDHDLIERIQGHYANQLPLAERWSDPDYVYSWRNPVGYYQRDRVRRAFITMLNRARISLSGGLLLDVGCGTGDWLRFFSELRGNDSGLIGLDLSFGSLTRGKLINAGIDTTLTDARHMPFADAQFSFVSQFVTFEHLIDLADLSLACAEVTRVCVPGGWLIWYDILPVRSDYQRGFSLEDVSQQFPCFRVVDHLTTFRNIHLLSCTVSTASTLARHSYLLADLVERLVPWRANNLMVLLQKNA